MGAATKKGHRLSDVVQHAKHALQSNSVKNAYAYIQTLISKPLDYAYLANAARGKLAEQAEQRINELYRQEQAALSEHRGKTYRAPNGDRWTVEEGAFVRTDVNGNMASVPHAHAPAIRTSITPGEWVVSEQPINSAR
jgi:hypothetical protein